ncbi:N-acetyltransferase [Marivibrio halodurans]|uniref:N-acetyltransferase n=1 Tax=Marivibrio halodurans TaxID=2039722 RepID=A0A8J7V1R4_9PROT|nr:N-acetyltransferase [Marivibrio halodurans]MBP5856376.1 N-acetyltransferase [Marivibrio halodurans]
MLQGAAAIRAERPADGPAIAALHRDAFDGPDEALLVDRLRADGDVVLSRVACAGPAVIGHILFSRMDAPFPALALAPLAVAADHRRQGIAAALIGDGLAAARVRGWVAVFVLGDPAYYQRFGFSHEAAAGFESPYQGPGFMMCAIDPGGLPAGGRGVLHHAPAFARLG